MSFTESALARIEELLGPDRPGSWQEQSGEMLTTAISLASTLYGSNSPQIANIESLRREVAATKLHEDFKGKELYMRLRGVLRSFASDLRAGRVVNLQNQVGGEVLGDFLSSARRALVGGFKEVAAVLASAALEDALKRFALSQGLNVTDKEMSDVINALKGKSLVQGPQAGLLSGFTKLRNKAFHAEWSAIEKADVEAAISFTQEFLLSRFPSVVS